MDQKLCSQWYIDQWNGILEGSGQQVAAKLARLAGADAQALFQNTPFGFLVREEMRA